MALLFVPVLAPAQPAPEPAPMAPFALAAWPTEKSLPGDVFAITQDREGYLWLGTPGGLVRFDGSRFDTWTQQPGASTLPAGPVHALTTASDGSLWVGFAGGGAVARIQNGRVTRFLPADGAPPGVNALLEDRHGTVWAATGHGLFRYATGRWSRVTRADGYEGEQAFSVYEDRRGRLWVGAATGLYRRDDASFQLVDPAATHVHSLIEDDDGSLWVTDRTAIVRKLDAPNLPRLDDRIRLPIPGWRLMRDRRGGLLVASFSGGLFRVADPTSPTPLLEAVPYEHRLHGSPRAVFQDRDNNIWVGMRGGLLRLSEHTFASAGPLDGLNHDGVRTAAVAADGSIWIATTHALNRFAEGTRQTYAISQTRALHSDRTGAMWVATEDLVGRSVNGRLIVEPIPGVQASRVNALALASDRLWLCTAYRGVLSWHARTLTSHRQPAESARQCLAILADRHDRVWAGFTSGGIALHEHGAVHAFTEADGLAPGSVLQIVEGRDGAIWFATSGGVSRYQRGRFTTITRANAPLDSVVPVLVQDEQGHVWVGVQSGAAVMRFHGREMDKVAEQPGYQIAYALYDESDGLQPGTQLWQSGVSGVLDAAGRVWVVNGDGMTIIDPRRLRDTRRPASPRFEVVMVNGERIMPAAARELPNGASVQIGYAALSLSAPSKLRFRHLLEGVDDGWVYDGEDRRAQYAALAPGEYRFRVSSTHDGQWTEPAVWTFSVAPPFYLRTSFLAATGAALLALLPMATWMRVRAVKTRYALVIAERTRVSREIHDTLLQSLAALGPELEALATRLPPDDGHVAAELRRVRRQVGRSVREARDSILELRRHPMQTPRLTASLGELADTTAHRHGVRPAVIVSGRRPEQASSDIDMQLFRIAQEAVTNAIQHGQATRIDIAVAYGLEQVALTIVDNGCGFRVDDLAGSHDAREHFGIITMRERAEKVGGQLHIESAPETGTTVRIVAPVTSDWL